MVKILAEPTIITYTSGLSATGVVFVGYMIGIVALIKYIREKKKLLPYLSAVGFCAGTFYLDIALSFYTFGNLIISGGGFYKMSKHTEGKIRLKCRQLVIGFILFSICNSLDMIVPVGIILVPIRIGLVISYLLIYQGFLIRKE